MGSDDMLYRQRLAEGFLAEAMQDLALQRWRSCVGNSQLAVENAAKLVLGIFGPVGKSHQPALALRRMIEEGRFSPDVEGSVSRLAECAEQLGPEIHIQSDYGDETSGLTPWELFGEDESKKIISLAQESIALALRLVSWADAHR